MNQSLRRIAGTAALIFAIAAPPAAVAEERTCRGGIGAETLDNVLVPDGSSCSLAGTIVKGTVKVERGATLATRDVKVIGNVQGENAAHVSVVTSSVGGSLQVKQGGAATVRRSTVNADIQYDANSRYLIIAENNVGGNVQVVGNRGGASITSNTVNGNLQCKENSPAPTGGNNRVHGSAEDQCARLADGSGAPAAVGPRSGGSVQPRPLASPRPRVTLRATRTAGRRVTLAGRVENTARRRGVVVSLQVRGARGWKTLRRVGTSVSGRYRGALRIRRKRHVALRAVVKRQRGVPARAVSRVAFLRLSVR